MTNLAERTRQHVNEMPDDGEREVLNEFISLRTGLIGAGLSKTPQDTNTTLADALRTIGSLFYLQRKMGIYIALTAAGTGMDSPTNQDFKEN